MDPGQLFLAARPGLLYMEFLHKIQEFIAQLNVMSPETAGFGVYHNVQPIGNFAE
jgi:hypothetical protein